jgi:Flp pilus assembly protein TadD
MIPDRSEAERLFFDGLRLMQQGDDVNAEANFKKALQIFPEFAESLTNLALLMEKRGDSGEAEANYRSALEINPSYFQTHLNLGALLSRQKRFTEAEATYKNAIALNPSAPEAWSNLGVLYACMKREAEAERCYHTAMQLDNRYSYASFNLAYLQLRQGRFEEGWRSLEARDWHAPLERQLKMPRWRGQALKGKSMLICCEAGFGDVIQFCRYADILKEQGASQISLLCHPPLKPLLTTLAGVDSIIALDGPLPSSGWDYWTPLLSIPYFCKTRLNSIPANLPYLHVLPERAEKWNPLLPDDDIKVGLVWRGSSRFENDADRSLPSLNLLAPLFSIGGVTFVSLQRGAGENDAAPAGAKLVRIGPQLADFADTAAVIAGLDLIISVDTAVAHLAGALGKPCWVLLPDYKTDWRWLKERTDSPWYPKVVRLFRQQNMQGWSLTIANVARSLELFAKK